MITQSVKKRMIIPGCPENVSQSNISFISVPPPIPVDSEAVSTTTEATKKVQTALTKCLNNNDLADIFTSDHLLGKMNSENVRVLSCM